MSFPEIKALLHSRIGLYAESVGASSIDRAIEHRMANKNCKTAADYLSLICADDNEMEELIEEVVVPETWFFRNKVPFELLRENGLKLYSESLKGGAEKGQGEEKPCLRALSLPCSTGEEPYSIAMALCESGLHPTSYFVDAVDISKRALRKARRAIYGKHSFREDGIHYQDKYFNTIKSGIRLSKSICDQVTFKQANIVTDSISPDDNYYNIIFCRNLLIYFDRDTQKLILEKISRMLKPGGLLFVGHAEAGQIDKAIFSKVRVSKSFAFRKRMTREADPLAAPVSKQGSVNKLKDIYNQLVEVARKDAEIANTINNSKASTQRPKQSAQNDSRSTTSVALQYDQLSKLINDGRLNEAESLCEQCLAKHPENADAYYFLGLISNIKGSHGGAESLLRKAIYLSPHHHKALALSAVLVEKRGDVAAAEALRRREKKARERNS